VPQIICESKGGVARVHTATASRNTRSRDRGKITRSEQVHWYSKQFLQLNLQSAQVEQTDGRILLYRKSE
jgi:hypothetical protein